MTPFVIAAIVGGGLVVFSLLGVGDNDGGHGLDAHGIDAHGIDTHGIEAHTGANADHDHHGDLHPQLHGHDIHSVLPLLSFRFWMFAVAGFGLIGVVLSLFDAGSLATRYVAAILGGLATGWIVWSLFRLLQRAESGPSDLRPAIGRTAKVVVAIRPGDLGKVTVDTDGSTVEYLARSDDHTEIPRGAAVVIVGLDGSVARVVSIADKELE